MKKKIKFKEVDIAKRWLVITEGCPLCAMYKKKYKILIADGRMEITDVGDDKGFELLTKMGIDEVPSVVIELKSGELILEK